MTSSEPCHHCGWPNDYTAAKDARISSLEAELNARNARCLEQHVAQATRISSLEAEIKTTNHPVTECAIRAILAGQLHVLDDPEHCPNFTRAEAAENAFLQACRERETERVFKEQAVELLLEDLNYDGDASGHAKRVEAFFASLKSKSSAGEK